MKEHIYLETSNLKTANFNVVFIILVKKTMNLPPLAEVVVRSVAVYLFIVLAIRLFGKKELAQLSVRCVARCVALECLNMCGFALFLSPAFFVVIFSILCRLL